MMPMRLRRFALAALFALGPGAIACGGLAAEEALTPEQTKAVEALIGDYLKRHPEAVLEALQALEARQQEAAAGRQKEMVGKRQEELLRDADTPVAGNPAGDVTVVEFFDYRCPYCKSVAGDMVDTLEADGNVRIVFKEFPILGPESVFAAKAALAADRQGKYRDFHLALMAHKGQLDNDITLGIATKSGLDIERLKADMAAPEIAVAIERNQRLAEDLDIRGTPAFVIGDQIVPGAISMDALKQLIEAERKG